MAFKVHADRPGNDTLEKLADPFPICSRLALDLAEHAGGIAAVGLQPHTAVRILQGAYRCRFDPAHTYIGQEAQNWAKARVASYQWKSQCIRLHDRIQGPCAGFPTNRAVHWPPVKPVARSIGPQHHALLSYDLEAIAENRAQLHTISSAARVGVRMVEDDGQAQVGRAASRRASMTDR